MIYTEWDLAREADRVARSSMDIPIWRLQDARSILALLLRDGEWRRADVLDLHEFLDAILGKPGR